MLAKRFRLKLRLAYHASQEKLEWGRTSTLQRGLLKEYVRKNGFLIRILVFYIFSYMLVQINYHPKVCNNYIHAVLSYPHI